MSRTFLTTKFKLYHEGSRELFFSLDPTDDDGKLEFFVEETILAGYDRANEEINSIVCDLTLDELEYIGKQFLEAVAFERKQLAEAPAFEEPVGLFEPDSEEAEKHEIASLLNKYKYDRRRVAAEMNISERTLYLKLAQYGLLKH